MNNDIGIEKNTYLYNTNLFLLSEKNMTRHRPDCNESEIELYVTEWRTHFQRS